MDLTKERSLILEMIADGKITVDEGEELLQALNASTRKNPSGSYANPAQQGFETGSVPPVPPVPAIPAMPAMPPMPTVPAVPPMPDLGFFGGRASVDTKELAAALKDGRKELFQIELSATNITADRVGW